MNQDTSPDKPRKPLIGHGHRRRSLRTVVVPLLIIVAIILFLPRLLEILE